MNSVYRKTYIDVRLLSFMAYDFEDGVPSHVCTRPRYKSRAERQIGELLHQRHIPHIYEKPIAVIDDGKTRIWYADFALQCGPLIEYFGINGKQDYIERTRHKLRVYQQNQFDVIPLYPPDITGSWQKNLLDRIGATLEKRLTQYRGNR